jgi:hypothetical protein
LAAAQLLNTAVRFLGNALRTHLAARGVVVSSSEHIFDDATASWFVLTPTWLHQAKMSNPSAKSSAFT